MTLNIVNIDIYMSKLENSIGFSRLTDLTWTMLGGTVWRMRSMRVSGVVTSRALIFLEPCTESRVTLVHCHVSRVTLVTSALAAVSDGWMDYGRVMTLLFLG